MPQVRSSAGLSLVLTYVQFDTKVRAYISVTLVPTKTLKGGMNQIGSDGKFGSFQRASSSGKAPKEELALLTPKWHLIYNHL